jgi:hypothetical protein
METDKRLQKALGVPGVSIQTAAHGNGKTTHPHMTRGYISGQAGGTQKGKGENNSVTCTRPAG